jgi:integrase/recombinase XerC
LSELVNIHLSDIDSSEQTLKVLGKGNKFRIVPLGRKAIEALDLWILQRNKLNKLVDAEFLFLNQQGKKLTARAIQYRLKFWAQKIISQRIFIPTFYVIVLPAMFYNRVKT